jgi:hypothetical protein
MDARYGPVLVALAIVAVMLVQFIRKIGRDDRLPLMDQPSSSDRRKVQIYVALIGVFALIVVAGIAVWTISAGS